MAWLKIPQSTPFHSNMYVVEGLHCHFLYPRTAACTDRVLHKVLAAPCRRMVWNFQGTVHSFACGGCVNIDPKLQVSTSRDTRPLLGDSKQRRLTLTCAFKFTLFVCFCSHPMHHGRYTPECRILCSQRIHPFTLLYFVI
jgi:hypothetical protein